MEVSHLIESKKNQGHTHHKIQIQQNIEAIYTIRLQVQQIL